METKQSQESKPSGSRGVYTHPTQSLAIMQEYIDSLRKDMESLSDQNYLLASRKSLWKFISAMLFALVVSGTIFTYNYTKALRENNITLYNNHKVDQLAIQMYEQALKAKPSIPESVKQELAFKDKAIQECITASAYLK